MYSKEDFERFSKKLEEIRKFQKEGFIDENAWQEIAGEIGFPLDELQNIRDAYLQKGKLHLQHQNTAEAIEALQNYLILQPNHLEAHGLLAKIYLEKWKTDKKKDDAQKARQYAEKCIEIDPKYQEAYKIIQFLNKPKDSTQTKSDFSNTKPQKEKINTLTSWRENLIQSVFFTSLSIVMLVYALFILLDIGGYFHPSRIPPNIDIFQTVANDKLVVSWMRTYKEYEGKRYDDVMHLINAQTGEEITQFPFNNINDIEFMQGRMYYFNQKNKDFEGRDAFTGEIVDSKKIMATHFDELKQGIGDVFFSYRSNQMRLIRKDGKAFYYSPEYNWLLPEEDMHDLSYVSISKVKWIYKYQWVRKKDPANSAKSTFILCRGVSQPTGARFYMDYSDCHGSQLSEKSPAFLDARPLYADSTFFLLKHENEISEDSQSRFTALDQRGKVMWELKEEEKSSLILLSIARNVPGKVFTYSIYRHKDKLILSSPNYPYRYRWVEMPRPDIAITEAFDLTTGKLLWRYSPNAVNLSE
jgi:tetratricopeptide (TPR) repeat protein